MRSADILPPPPFDMIFDGIICYLFSPKVGVEMDYTLNAA